MADDDHVLDIAGHENPKLEEKRTEEFVEIQRVAIAGENIVPAGAEAEPAGAVTARSAAGSAQIALAAAAGRAS